ncbi:MAG TPA: DUF3306 domain-containing protein [Azospirillum sp.]|nr:DUF3306 domain-containing protein [Azospirillum sp.]
MTDESFLSRWSRLKRKEAEPRPPEPEAPEPVPATPPAVADSGAPPAEAVEEDVLKDLPPVESLTADSDFTPFLRDGVPEDLHRQALRKLWTSDPVYANDDGLKDYADDYTGLFNGGVVKTLYRVGKGFLDAAEEVAGNAQDATGETVAAAVPSADDGSMDKAAAPENSDSSSDMIKKS